MIDTILLIATVTVGLSMLALPAWDIWKALTK